jgi:hypothetical protein
MLMAFKGVVDQRMRPLADLSVVTTKIAKPSQVLAKSSVSAAHTAKLEAFAQLGTMIEELCTSQLTGMRQLSAAWQQLLPIATKLMGKLDIFTPYPKFNEAMRPGSDGHKAQEITQRFDRGRSLHFPQLHEGKDTQMVGICHVGKVAICCL